MITTHFKPSHDFSVGRIASLDQSKIGLASKFLTTDQEL